MGVPVLGNCVTLGRAEYSKAIGGEFEMVAVVVNVAKSGSLKKNYGSINVRKRRRRIEPNPE